VTLHRPANVDDPDMLRRIMSVLAWASEQLAIVFPVHPRTRKRLHDLAFSPPAGLRLTDPLSYLEFLALQQRAAVVLTDSGGIQEESTFLGVPCLTLRDNTERPVTVTIGTNTVVGRDPAALRRELQKVLNGEPKRGHIPPLWDGKAGTRIANALTSYGT